MEFGFIEGNESNIRFAAYALEHVMLSFGKKSHTYTRFTSPASPAGAVDVLVAGLGRLHLNNQVNLGEVESSSSHIGGNDTVDLSSLELPECALPCDLLDIAMQAFGLQRKIVRITDSVNFSLCLAEDDHLAVFIFYKLVDKGPNACLFLVGSAGEGVVFDRLRSPRSLALDKVDKELVL